MVTKSMTDGEDYDYRYVVWLLIKHPNLNPADITESPELTPRTFVAAGSARTTPTGDALPGVHKESAWSYWFRVEKQSSVLHRRQEDDR